MACRNAKGTQKKRYESYNKKIIANLEIAEKQKNLDKVLNDIKKLEDLAQNAHTRDFKDLAKLHLASIRGDKMSATELEEYLSSMNTKKSPFFYTARLMVAEKYLAENNKDKADPILDMIISDKDAPSSVSATAQMLR